MTSRLMLPLDDRRRLWAACGAAALLHLALLFGIHISSERTTVVSLEVTLLAIPGSQSPLAAKVLAPVASTGGGTHRELRTPTTRPGSPFELAGLRHAADLAMQAVTNPNGSIEILSTESAAEKIHSDQKEAALPGQDAALLLQRREQAGNPVSSTEPTLSHQAVSDELPGAESGLTTRASRQAAYRELWRKKVERAGSVNFPWSALTTGQPKSLTLLVTIRFDGGIRQTRVVRSSGVPPLDKAALDILRMAAPFPPFPDDLRQTTPELSFMYDWEFLPGDRAALRIGR